jgi:hypothetical protein
MISFLEKYSIVLRILKIIRNMNIIIIIIALCLSVIVNLFLIYRGLRLIKMNEILAQKNITDRLYIFNVLEHMLSDMREIDIRGSFESDDEVGSVFDELKQTIKKYKENI